MSQHCDASGLQSPPRGDSADRQAPETGGAATRRFNHGLKRAGTPDSLQMERDPWRQLLRLVAVEYPYCTMYGVNIVDGNIISCQNIQRSLLFGPEGEGNAPEPAFDEYWEALKELCGKVRTGTLIELHFSQSRPVSARKSEGGRRFRRLLQKTEEGLA